MQAQLNKALSSNVHQREQLRRSIEAQCVNWTQDPDVRKPQAAFKSWFGAKEFKELASDASNRAKQAITKPPHWKADRSAILIETVRAMYPDAKPEDVDQMDWEEIAKTEGLTKSNGKVSHSAESCMKAWLHRLGDHLNPEDTWASEEEKLLYKLAREHKDHDWELIAAQLPRRSAMQCAKRHQRGLNPRLVSVKWEHDEDMQLRDAVELCGEVKQWGKIALMLENKSAGQCTTRWHVTVKQESKK
jgi:Myb-like DNA-binding domain